MTSKVKTDGEDYYAALGLEAGATATAISKAYKKLALKHHPDRNPNDPLAAQRFHAIQQAYDVLTDPEARAAFDQLLQARLHRKRKIDAMDAQRRAKRQDLEERENAFKRQRADELDAQRRLAARMARLKEEAAARIQREQERRQEQAKQQQATVAAVTSDGPDGAGDTREVVVKLKWGRKEGWDEQGVRRALERAGCPAPLAVVVRRRGGGALATFSSRGEAERAISHLPAPITGHLRSQSTSPSSGSAAPSTSAPQAATTAGTTTPSAAVPEEPTTSASAGMTHADFESQVLARMMQAAAAMRQSAPPTQTPQDGS